MLSSAILLGFAESGVTGVLHNNCLAYGCPEGAEAVSLLFDR
jgi:hypothetical protein